MQSRAGATSRTEGLDLRTPDLAEDAEDNDTFGEAEDSRVFNTSLARTMPVGRSEASDDSGSNAGAGTCTRRSLARGSTWGGKAAQRWLSKGSSDRMSNDSLDIVGNTSSERSRRRSSGGARAKSSLKFGGQQTGTTETQEELLASLERLQWQKRCQSNDSKGEFGYICSLAKKHHISVDECRDVRQEFNRLDVDKSGSLTLGELSVEIRAKSGLDEDAEIPQYMLTGLLSKAHGEGINFEEYLTWSIQTAYVEDFVVRDPRDKEMRAVAREQGIHINDVEKVRRVFDKFDTDGSGIIDEHEFIEIVYLLMKVREPADISPQKLKRYWREVDTDLSGHVCFKEFLVWYTKMQLIGGRKIYLVR